jgi:acyl-CoA synthetase (AMP-forming)/AMP-acid ligase II
LTAADVFFSALPAPFGFGLWTGHFTPTILGAPCVLLDRFSPEAALAATTTTQQPAAVSRVKTLNAMSHIRRKTTPPMITVAAMRRAGPLAAAGRVTGSLGACITDSPVTV